MTPEEAANELRAFARSFPALLDRVGIVAFKRLEAFYKRRIFNEGKTTAGGPIGTYSDNPISVKREAFIQKNKFKGTGRGSTMYLPGGYKQLREIQGRESEYVNLDYTGSLRRSIQTGRIGGRLALGFTDEERFAVAQELEERFNAAIFSVSVEEDAAAQVAVTNEIRLLLTKNGF